MRAITIGFLGILLTTTLPAAERGVRTVTFSKDKVGKVPTGWKVDKTGKGEGSVWKVMADKTAPSGTGYVLAQTAKGPNRLFNLCVMEKSSLKDVEISVHFKSVTGKIDQGGGVVWRYQDANNYYICRYNPLEENFRVYKVEGGKRTQLQSKGKLPLATGKWYTLSITQVGERIQCSLNGKKYLDVKDDTFKDAGKVGLWTKADAVTSFDNFKVKAAK